MKISKTSKFLIAGLLAGTLTFVGCKSDKSAETTEGTTDTQQTTPPPEGTTPAPTEGTSPETPPPGTGGGGSGTKASDDNMRAPEEDPLRTPREESIPEAEAEPGVHSPEPGTGGSGLGDEPTDEGNLNEGGNSTDDTLVPDSPSDTPPESGVMDDSQIPEGAR